MRTDAEKEHLFKAIDCFGKRFIVVSPDFEILAYSSPFSGIRNRDLVGSRCYKVLHGRTSPCENCAVKEVIKTGVPVLRPKPEESMDFDRMPCYYAYPVYSGDEVESYVSMDFDLPTTSELEQKLRRSDTILRNLINSAVDCVIAADKTGKVIIFNEAAAKVFGFSISEALNDLNIVDIYPEGGAYKVMRELRKEDHGGKGKLREYRVDVFDRGGNKIPISLNAAILYENGKEAATIGFFHDMREKLEMEKDLERTRHQLIQSEKMASLGKLAAGVAHQLNNPLGGITLFTKLILEEYQLEEAAVEDLNRILNDAERCRDTVKELLEFSRQSRELRQPYDLNQALNRTLSLLENQTLFHNIEIVKELSDSLPKAAVDIQQINHVFMNIILNAVQAMKGEGTLKLVTRPLPDDKGIRIEIIDSGPGIPEEIIGRIFEPFFTTKQEGEGTGLGLSLVYRIVENHGGRIWMLNGPNGGAIFKIELPISETNSERGEREQQP